MERVLAATISAMASSLFNAAVEKRGARGGIGTRDLNYWSRMGRQYPAEL
jgi:hypothetical protein